MSSIALRFHSSTPVVKLSYESRLEDVVEPAVRLFLRSKTYRTNKWRGTLLCAGVFAVFAFLGFHARDTISVVWICIAAAAWGAGIYLITYKGTVRRRIERYIATETQGKLLETTHYEVTPEKLTATTLGVDVTFRLSDLQGISEDATRLELSFGEKGPCVIPLRAFQSPEEKTAFLAAVQRSTIAP
jgi:hypothetical protein